MRAISVLLCSFLGALAVPSASPAYEYHELLDPHALFTASQSWRHPSRPATETACTVFFDQRSTRDGSKTESSYDKLLEVPLDFDVAADQAYTVHVTVQSRFLSTQRKGVASLVKGDLVVALTDGTRVIGFQRRTTTARSKLWGLPLSAAYGERALRAASVTLAESAPAACVGENGCSQVGAEAFEVVFSLGARTSVVARSIDSANNGAAGVEYSDDLRTAGKLRLVLHGAEWDHAYELGAVEVRVNAREREQSLSSFATVDAFVAAASAERFSAIWPAFALRNEQGGEPRDALFASDRSRQLRDGCGLEFEAVRPVAGVAFANLVALPLLPANALRSDRQYVLHVTLRADSNTPRNTLLVGVADGVESGAHVVGFARGDRQSAALGSALGGLLARNNDLLQIEARQFEAREGGLAAADANQRSPQLELDLVLGGGATRVLASAPGARAGADAFVDTDRFGLDVTQPLYVVLMQRAEGTSESTTVRLLSVSVDEVRVGCDGIPNSGQQLDKCGVCGGHDECVGCDGVANSGKLLDACGVCAGDSSSCADCNGVPNGPAVLDSCGVCGGHDECKLRGSGERALAYKQAQAERFADTGELNVHEKRSLDDGPHLQKRAVLGKAPTETVKDARDCTGRLKREGGTLEYDACGVCGGDNACVGCDGRPFGKHYDDCGVCGGDNSTCCTNYCDVPNAYWDFMLLPVTLDNILEKMELTYSVIQWLNENLPSADDVDAQAVATLNAGRLAEFNRIFLHDCLDEFCELSGNLYRKLVHDNLPFVVHEHKRTLQLGSI